jgi:hypothetical protein
MLGNLVYPHFPPVIILPLYETTLAPKLGRGVGGEGKVSGFYKSDLVLENDRAMLGRSTKSLSPA